MDVERRNTIGLNARDLQALLDRLDGTESSAARQRRASTRQPYRLHCVEVDIQQPDGAWVRAFVACRNLSQGGLSILHNAFLYTGTECRITLPSTDGEPVLMFGRVVRCRLVEKKIHEIGIAFDHPEEANRTRRDKAAAAPE